MTTGSLFLVATPIGNLDDISGRALNVLRSVDLVICEDTRHSHILLRRYGISTPTKSLPAFAERKRAVGIVDALVRGKSMALITDAGSPGISDPGEALVRLAVESGIAVLPIPGACAAIAALSASGLRTGRFHFLGFLPRKQSEAATMLEEVSVLRATLVLYEAPGRVAQTLAILARTLGGSRKACLARELTKIHEEFLRGSLDDLCVRLEGSSLRGEVVILVSGAPEAAATVDRETVQAMLRLRLASGTKLKEAARDVARAAGWKAADVYRIGLSG